MDTRTNCGFADGWSKPHPYREVPAKQQFTICPSFYVSLGFRPFGDSTRVFTTTGKAGPTGAATSR